MKYYFLTLLICLSLFSCKKKEVPTQTNGTAIFKFIGTVNGDSVNYQAGVDRMYMYTGYFKDTQNLLTVKSYFGKDNCINCDPYLSFEVKDFESSSASGLAGTIADLIKGGGVFNSYSLDSILSTTDVETFYFYPLDNKVGTIYNWDFGDLVTSFSSSPAHIFTGGGLRDVRLITTSGGIKDTVVNTINTTMADSNCRVQFNLSIDTFTNKVTVFATPLIFSSYAWNFGNGQFGTSAQDTSTYTTPGKYTISLSAFSGPACTTSFKQKVNFSLLPQVLANFNYYTGVSTITAQAPRINKSAFIITWKKDGKEYRSYKNAHGLDQSGNPVFTFTGVMPYINNDKGDPTLLVTGTVDTYLYNINNWQDSIKIKSSDIVLAAAYPK